MISQPGQNVITILPDSYGHDQWSLRRDRFEYVHPHTLIPNKAVLQCLIIGMRPFNNSSLSLKRTYNLSFHICLSGPTGLVG
jgi:hypothetical protein